MSKVIAEHYELRSQIGRGGLATVYQARDLRSGVDVALKVVHQHLSEDARFVALFRQQALAAARVTHTNVARVLDYGRWHDTYYLVEELVHGSSLAEILAKRGRLSPVDALSVGAAVATALAAAHGQQTVHRDLRPGNVLVDALGIVKVTDFGLAQAASQTGLTMTTMALGTAYYAAPEQIQGQPTTPAADVYSLGVMLYEMLAGRRPFEGSNPLHVAMQHINEDPPDLGMLVPELSEAIRRSINRMLGKDPHERLADGAAALRSISSLPEHAPHHVFNASQPIRVGGSTRRGGSRLAGTLVGLLILALVAGSGGVLAVAGSQYLHAPSISELPAITDPQAADPAPQPADIAVPSLVGLSLNQATDRLAQSGLFLGSVASRESSPSEIGEVVEQTPAAGKPVAPDTRVRLILGSGPAAPLPSASSGASPRQSTSPAPSPMPDRSDSPTAEPKSPTATPRQSSSPAPSSPAPTPVATTAPSAQPQSGDNQASDATKPPAGGAVQPQGTANAGTNQQHP
ncbi:MAG: PASTA domain-containing protein [Chloroflexota bacterium]|nr:MAG: PASTA domain-containing protein [Chloroflexota bacterium]